ncbi:ParB/RepB/Spo0J family partition protein [Xanthomonas citri]|uniref:ParB/RepB/Spo0J family partition protein n=2 Tax=Xanthomonas citri TaxID=346 RepID=UPI0018DE8549|nr:ParB/RepB/Spo0J family partition protein [Xanthomonas citri]
MPRSRPSKQKPALLSPNEIKSAAISNGRKIQSGAIVVCDQSPLPFELAYGSLALSHALRLAKPTVTAWIAPPEALEALKAADDRDATWTQLADAAAALRAAGVPSVEIAALLSLHPADITRLSDLNQACDKLRGLVSSGQISAGHSRILAKLDHPDQAHWSGWCLAHKPSVKQLAQAIAGKEKAAARLDAPDLGPFLAQLSEALGTAVELEDGELRLAFYSPEEVKGLMERLSRGPDGTSSPASSPSWLRIPITDNDCLHELTGHLIQM